jgi:hypothetical protein
MAQSAKEKGYGRAQQPSGESQIPRELVELSHWSGGIGILPVPPDALDQLKEFRDTYARTREDH